MNSFIKRLVCLIPFLLTLQYNKAQNPTLTITSANIANEGSIATNESFVVTSCFLSTSINIKLKATGTEFRDNLTGKTIPLNKQKIKLLTINGGAVSGTEIILTTSDQTLYNNALSLSILNVTLGMSYYFNTGISQKWEAGIYTCPIIYTVTTTLLGVPCVLMANGTITLQVNSFINAATSNVSLTVNSLGYFRNTAVSQAPTVDVTATVPYKIRIKTSASSFTFSGSPNPNTSVGLVSATPPSGTLSMGFLDILTSAIDPGISGNTISTAVTYSITPANLVSGFINSGSYGATMTYEIYDTRSSPPMSAPVAATRTLTPSFSVPVSEMVAITVNHNSNTLNFATPADYVNGKVLQRPAHITLSRTTAYDLAVKSGNTNLQAGLNTIPVSIVQVGPADSQGGVSSIHLSAANQNIVSNAPATVDRSIGIKYYIAPADVATLLGKPQGSYTGTVTYTITAH